MSDAYDFRDAPRGVFHRRRGGPPIDRDDPAYRVARDTLAADPLAQLLFDTIRLGLAMDRASLRSLAKSIVRRPPAVDDPAALAAAIALLVPFDPADMLRGGE